MATYENFQICYDAATAQFIVTGADEWEEGPDEWQMANFDTLEEAQAEYPMAHLG